MVVAVSGTRIARKRLLAICTLSRCDALPMQASLSCLTMLLIFSKRCLSRCERRVREDTTRKVAFSNSTTSSASQASASPERARPRASTLGTSAYTIDDQACREGGGGGRPEEQRGGGVGGDAARRQKPHHGEEGFGGDAWQRQKRC